MARILGAGVLGGLTLFVVGFLWWGLPVGPGSQVARKAPRESDLQAVLLEHLPESGVYFVPAEGMTDEGEARDRFMERHRRGPLATMVFHREGKEPFDVKVMVLGFLHVLVASLLAALFLRRVAGGRRFAARWATVAFLGAFVMYFDDLAGLLWWSEPPAWVAVQAGYSLVGWALAGLPIAALAKRPPTAP